jgi:hypothetical protein
MQDDDLPQGLMQAILLPLINELLPIVGNDKDVAWESAEAATMSLNPQSPIEFRLAVRIALFNIQANRLTAEANAPALTPACAIRMRLCALSYAREADKAERRLEKLQTARIKEQEQQPEPASPEAEPAITPTEQTTTQAQQSPAADVPAYKRLKQERRLAKQRDRDARLKALAEAWAQEPDQNLAA